MYAKVLVLAFAAVAVVAQTTEESTADSTSADYAPYVAPTAAVYSGPSGIYSGASTVAVGAAAAAAVVLFL
ncbi:hypothetical protein HK100_000063 [Physocladia obscura]|uniref:Uncharacterized protein n=1 Tax=Physocladia obscura TaxID=109957 RepID=A0AAD5T0Q5_9FUNG|nr:hypothetical protein HK100_000063 [Physocladia obscura]